MLIMKRVWDVIVGLVMIALSMVVQLTLYIFLTLSVFSLTDLHGVREQDPVPMPLLVVGFTVVFNGIACFEYFRRRRQAVLGGAGMRPAIHAFKAIAIPDSGHISMIIFLVPRGLDRILFGKERIQGVAEIPVEQ